MSLEAKLVGQKIHLDGLLFLMDLYSRICNRKSHIELESITVAITGISYDNKLITGCGPVPPGEI